MNPDATASRYPGAAIAGRLTYIGLVAPSEQPSSDLVVVANRLPVARRGDSDEWDLSPGGLVTALVPIMQERDGTWVGWHGGTDPAPAPFRTAGITVWPVGLTEDELAGYYEGFSNATLWPLYHGALRPFVAEHEWWDRYVDVNRRFAAVAAEAVAHNGTVWIHDYHLQLVPAMLRELRQDVRLGFFLHTPFPPSELHRRLPWRRQIIEGILGSDVVGFQTARDAENFVSMCAGETDGELVVDDGRYQLHWEGRTIEIGEFPVSIDVAGVSAIAAMPGPIAAAKALRKQLGNPRTVLLGIDRLDYTKGIEARLEALNDLLARGAVKAEDVAFIQVANPSRGSVEGYDATRENVERLVGALNGTFAEVGRPVVHYLHQSFSFDELMPMYLAADVMVVTPYRDGMNLVAKEYVTARVDDSGVLLLSEFAGAAEELDGAVLCNPFDAEGLSESLLRAIEMDPDEGRERMHSLRQIVADDDVHHWADGFLKRSEAAPPQP